jgi:hypothetical protein|nr:MAG TPA: hypothetical protein [Caudoviricetes sp.]
MGFLSKAFKGVNKFFKKAIKAPFHFVRDTGRAFNELGQGVGQLAKGDVEGAFKSAVGAVGQATKGALDLTTAGGVSEDGWLMDTKVKEASSQTLSTAANSNDAAVSFAEAGAPSVVIGADEVEEDVIKRKNQASAGFLGGVASSGSSILIG